MKKTTFPEDINYKSRLGRGVYQTNYGYISSYNGGAWYHDSYNQQGRHIGEVLFSDTHYYKLML